MKYTIDAKNKKLGRVASQAAQFLMGKGTADFKKNAEPSVSVEITNASKMELTEKKQAEKEYQRYSGYPGGRKTRSLKEVINKKGKGYEAVLKTAVNGMLPKNKLQPLMMKNLIIKA